jgi:hypothetical protein
MGDPTEYGTAAAKYGHECVCDVGVRLWVVMRGCDGCEVQPCQPCLLTVPPPPSPSLPPPCRYAVAANLDGVDFDLENLSQNCSYVQCDPNPMRSGDALTICSAILAACAPLPPIHVIARRFNSLTGDEVVAW